MTLEQKIRPHARYWDCYNDEPELYNHTGKLVKIIDLFTIDFCICMSKQMVNLDSDYKKEHFELLLKEYKKTL